MKRLTRETKIDLIARTYLTTPNATEVSRVTGISRSNVCEIMKTDDFQEKLQEMRDAATDNAVNYMSANLTECAETLMQIVRDKEASDTVRINACNAIFQNLKGLSGKDGTMMKWGLVINDSIK